MRETADYRRKSAVIAYSHFCMLVGAGDEAKVLPEVEHLVLEVFGAYFT